VTRVGDDRFSGLFRECSKIIKKKKEIVNSVKHRGHRFVLKRDAVPKTGDQKQNFAGYR